MEELNDQIAQRLKKLDQLRSLGIDPFGGKFDVQDRAGDLIARYGTMTKEALEQKPITTTIAGRVIALRWFGKAAFASLQEDRKSTRLNSSHGYISYAVFCLKKKKTKSRTSRQLYATLSIYQIV